MVAPHITIDAATSVTCAPRQHWRSKQVAPLRKRPQPSGIHKHFITIHLRTIRASSANWHPIRYTTGMTVSSHNQVFIADHNASPADILLVRVSPAAIVSLPPDSFSHVQSGQEALGLLRLSALSPACGEPGHPGHARLGTFPQSKACPITAAMRPPRRTNDARGSSSAFGKPAPAQFASCDPAVCAALVGSSPRIARATTGALGNRFIPAQQQPGPAPRDAPFIEQTLTVNRTRYFKQRKNFFQERES